MERPIEFHALGSIELSRDGIEIADVLAQPKRFSLFAYLALSPRRFYRRDTLVALLWPELDASHARHALRQTLYYLRSHLEEPLFVVRGDEIGIDPSRLWCDVTELDGAWGRGDLARVAELYRGELLEGFHSTGASPEFEYWLDRERFRLQLRVSDAHRRLAEEADARDDLDDAIRWARARRAVQSADEGALLALMSFLRRGGKREMALEEYRAFVAQNGFEVSEEVETLARRLQAEAERGWSTRKICPPSPPSSLIGRRRSIEQARQLLDDGARLLTLTGPGGVGKTRLAIEIALEMQGSFEGGAAWAALAGVRDPARVPDAVGEAVGLEPHPSGFDEARLISWLECRELLLVLDNFEHLLAAAPFVADLTQRCTGMTVLITSRSPLKVRGEQELDVPPLSLPDPDRMLGGELPFDSEAVALFVERVRAVTPAFRLTDANASSVIEICRRLDGLPLAIELAAPRMKIMSPGALANRLGSQLPLLTGGARDLPERQRALEDTIRWSVELLDPAEQELLYGLSVFVGGCDLDAVERVTTSATGADNDVLDLLSALIDTSLLSRVQTEDGDGRFAMLESIREYGMAELARADRLRTWRGAHAAHYAAWVEEGSRRDYCSPAEPAWLERIAVEHENLEAAIEWSLRGDTDSASRIAASLTHFWCVRGRLAEGRSCLERLLARGSDMQSESRARCLGAAAYLRAYQGQWDEAIDFQREILDYRKTTGDRKALVGAFHNLGEMQREAGRLEEARASMLESLAIGEETGFELCACFTHAGLGIIDRIQGRLDSARWRLETALEHARKIKHEGQVATVLRELAAVARDEGRSEDAMRLLEQSARILEGLGRPVDMAGTLERLAAIREPIDPLAARILYARALGMYREGGYMWGMAQVLAQLARIALADGRADLAVQLLGGVEELWPAEAERAREILERASDDLGPSTSAALRATGRAMTPERLLRRVDELIPAVEIPLSNMDPKGRSGGPVRTFAEADSAGAPAGNG